uniref:Apoptosis, caspase activation inhibitor n=1 Tax=Gasterosteus aculeatus aculeatus TaxID=481459 RepID=A0AAQ4QV25_GASAC
MDTRPSAVRGGSWRRGGRGGSNGESVGGEQRGRGRGGHHRGRGKRDHYRGRGRGGSGPSADFQHRDKGEDEGDNFQEEGDRKEVFSRRKLASNWDRYEASEREEPDEDTPTQRGTDYHVLLESAERIFHGSRFEREAIIHRSHAITMLLDEGGGGGGIPLPGSHWSQKEGDVQAANGLVCAAVCTKGAARPTRMCVVCVCLHYEALSGTPWDCFTQFRFSEEKEWEMDSAASQMSAVFVDLPALAEILQQVPLHQRLNLEAELLQISTPLELPGLTLPVKQAMAKTATFTLPSAALKIVSSSDPPVSSSAAEPPVDDDEELDQLLSLQKPVWHDSGGQSVSVAPKRACEQVQEKVPVLTEEKTDEVKNKDVNPRESASVRQEMTEEDLEDWLDSMIS